MEQLLDAKHPVLFHHNAIYDRMLALPTVRAIASVFPGRLKIFCAEGGRDLLYSDLDVAGVYETPIRRGNSEWTFDASAVAEAIGECDLFICPNPWYSDDIGKFIGHFPSAETLGFFRAYKHRQYLDEDKHGVDSPFDILQLLKPALRPEDFAQPLQLPSENVEDARRLRSQISAPFRVMVIETDTGLDKQWPVERFVSVLDKFFARHPDHVAFVVDPEDRGLNTGKFGSHVFPCPQLPLATAFALVGESDLYFGIDSPLMHAADFSRVPGVGLFGPAWPERWKGFGFRFGPHRHVSLYDGDAASEDAVLSALESIVADTQHPQTKTA